MNMMKSDGWNETAYLALLFVCLLVVAIGNVQMQGIDWSVIRVGTFNNPVPQPFTNIDQVSLVGYLPLTPNQQDVIASQKQQAHGIKLWAEGNIVATAQTLGTTNIPIPWVDFYNVLDEYASTNPSGQKVSQDVQAWLSFYTLNGGDAWKVGCDLPVAQIKKIKVVRKMPKSPLAPRSDH